jgi:hypothetical protein
MDWKGNHGMQRMHIGSTNVLCNFYGGGGDDPVFEKARFIVERR